MFARLFIRNWRKNGWIYAVPKGFYREIKRKQPHPEFHPRSPLSFPMKITIGLWAPTKRLLLNIMALHIYEIWWRTFIIEVLIFFFLIHKVDWRYLLCWVIYMISVLMSAKFIFNNSEFGFDTFWAGAFTKTHYCANAAKLSDYHTHLAPSHFFWFPKLKIYLSCKNAKDIKRNRITWLYTISREEFLRCFR